MTGRQSNADWQTKTCYIKTNSSLCTGGTQPNANEMCTHIHTNTNKNMKGYAHTHATTQSNYHTLSWASSFCTRSMIPLTKALLLRMRVMSFFMNSDNTAIAPIQQKKITRPSHLQTICSSRILSLVLPYKQLHSGYESQKRRRRRRGDGQTYRRKGCGCCYRVQEAL